MVAVERGQLMLVGAIAIGIVLIGMTAVLNSAVFTENVAQGSSIEVTGDVREFDRMATRNLQSLAIRVNHASTYNNPGGAGKDQLRDDLAENVTTYSGIMAEAYADTGSVYVNVTHESETLGGRIVQTEDRDFTTNPGNGSNPDWQLISDPFELGWFVMNLEVENVSETNPVVIQLTDATGSQLNVSLRQTSDGDLDLRSDIDGANVSDVTCEPTNGRVLLDVADGASYTGDCTFNSTDHLAPTLTEIRFVDGDNARGKYDVVVNRTDPSAFAGVPACQSTNSPCRTVAAWSMNFTTHYQSGSVDFERTHRVEVYG